MRAQRHQQAQETLRILEQGWYENATGVRVDIRTEIEHSRSSSRLVRPSDWSDVLASALNATEAGIPPAITVTGETTLQAASRLIQTEGRTQVYVLNFASAKHPGGGFLGGSQAQEEGLARASGLYICLLEAMEYYRANRSCASNAYTDHAVFSPQVPFFRDDDGGLLDVPYTASVLTMPAANAGAMSPDEAVPEHLRAIMTRRARYVLAHAAVHGHRTLVLGAWGCGVFRNEPELIADAFDVAIREFGRKFESIVFAVYDRSASQQCFRAFNARFGGS